MSRFFYYALAFFLVPIYSQSFVIWAWLSKQIPEKSHVLIPLAVILLTLTAFLPFLWKNRSSIEPRYLASAIGLILFCYFLTDPRFPAKRVHIAQYIFLSLLIYKALPLSIGFRHKYIFYTTWLTLLLGIHDEMIQGLHPLRTFGLRDIAVDSFSALAGILLLTGIGFVQNTKRTTEKVLWSDYLVFISVWILLLLLPNFRKVWIPGYILLPLIAASLLWIVQALRMKREEPVWFAFLLSISLTGYIVGANYLGFTFN
ncbi:MAG: VanZ family protein [Spirochaetota bacterium]